MTGARLRATTTRPDQRSGNRPISTGCSMRVLAVHNFYQQPGGEDAVFAAECSLLRAHGHEVIEYTEDNRRIETRSKLGAALDTVWSLDTSRTLAQVLRDARPDVAHFHNTFPLISPSAYYACRAAGVPVVQTLHNYRLGCPKATLHRDGRVCEDCLGRNWAWPGVVHACYRDDRAATAVTAMAIGVHRLIRTWNRAVDVYIALTNFSRSKQIAAGLPSEKVVVKPNFVHPDPGQWSPKEDYAVFVGRLSAEKDPDVLLRAWQLLEHPPALRVLGDGPLRESLGQYAAQMGLDQVVDLLGRQPRTTVIALLQRARVLVFPSGCYENFPVAIVEAFACGTPIIATRHGAMAELVTDGRTGLLFTPGNARELAAAVEWAWAHPAEMERMGDAGRRQFEEQYTAELNYERLLEIYALAAARRAHP
jgi:glycosyltransferase involved in cell wall biosynthesis